jgi:signal transduction histidine kinase/ActR/RegA family two-component response regulator
VPVPAGAGASCEEKLAAANARVADLERQLAAAQALARQSQHQLATLADNLPMGLLLVSSNGRIELMNAQFRELFGLPAASGEEAAAVKIDDCFRDPASFAARAWSLYEQSQTVLQEEFTLADGRVVALDYVVIANNPDSRLICYRDVTEHRRRAAQQRTVSFIPQQNPNPVLRLDATGRVVHANPAAEPLAHSLAAAAPAEWQQHLFELADTALHTARQHQQELVIAGQHFLCTAVALPGEALVTLYLTDITAWRRAEEKMARQQEFYESILNYLPVDIAVFDADHRHLFINPSSISDPNLRQQIVGMTNAEYFALRQRPAVLGAMREQYFRQAVRTRTDVSWEETLPGPNGPKRVLRTLRAVFAPDDTLRLVVGSGIDITSRYAAEERQRQSEALLREQQGFIRLIVDTLPNILYVMNEKGQVVFHNAAFDALAARSSHPHPLQLQAIPVEAEIAQLVAWRWQVMSTRKPLDAELPLTMKTGETCHLHVHIRPLDRANGEREVVVVGTDITDLKRAQQAADANAKAKEAFLARMSHEIRTPLNGVLGMVLLLQKTTLTPAQQEYLATMQRAGQHLLTLVNDVLDLAKITSHHLELDHAPFDVAVLLHSASQTMAPLASQKGIELDVIVPPLSEIRVLGDVYRLHQVLLNLLSNALKFTEQGSVRFGVTLMGATAEAVSLRFWVQDTGLGIAPEQQEHIFELFAQASSDTSRHFGGTGLGLAISEQLVHQMGGMLRLCSQPGEGTIFSFTLALPVATEAPPTSPPPAIASYEGLRGIRVLLAEDNAVNQWIARSLLEHWGVQVEAVGTGTEALNLLSTQDFDAALLDIRMPGLSGVEVTTAIRQHANARRAQVPIIALTANAFDADRQHYLAVGMNGCVTKPFAEADLCQLLLQLTRKDP